jgi:hypothetical protein
MAEQRRSQRRRAREPIRVDDAIRGETIGYVGNLSNDGMLLIANREPADGALLQVTFDLPGSNGRPHRLEIGVHEQWGEPARSRGQYWCGFRIIDIASEDRAVLTAWTARRDDAP